MVWDEALISKLGHDVKKDCSQSLVNLARKRRSPRLLLLAFGGEKTKGGLKTLLTLDNPGFIFLY